MDHIDQAKFNWIDEARSTAVRVGRNRVRFVSNLVPTVFEKYAKIFHWIRADRRLFDEPLTAAERQVLKFPKCAELRQFVSCEGITEAAPRVLWRQLALLFDLRFVPEFSLQWLFRRMEDGCWGLYLNGPQEGALTITERRDLVQVLNRFTPAELCFYRVPEIPFSIKRDEPLVYQGKLSEVELPWRPDLHDSTPEYWWPPDQSWCVCSDYDDPFTIVGGPPEMIDCLLRSHVLECIEVAAYTRVDEFVSLPKPTAQS